MSTNQNTEDDLAPSTAPSTSHLPHSFESLLIDDASGYNIDAERTTDDYSFDAQDESLARWQASLGIVPSASGQATGPKVTVLELQIHSPSLSKPIIIDVQKEQNANETKRFNLKQGIEYHMSITFKVNHSVVSGLRYIQDAHHTGLREKTGYTIGSYGPQAHPYTKHFDTNKTPPPGLLYSGAYHVTSYVKDEDNEVYAEWRWIYELRKDW
ncbi:hypothetical protein H0H93_002691 [Arthromyces matolae]|nr:hypothetical protein H0H93_002691 [Arthromyces matolae]